MPPNQTWKTLAIAGVFVTTTFLLNSNLSASEAVNTKAPVVVDAEADGFSIRFERSVNASAEHVYQALTDDIGQWWLAAHTWYGKSANMSLSATAGGCFCEIAADGRETEHLRVIKVEPNRLIRFSGGLGPLQGEGLSGVMDWQLEAVSNTTSMLTLSYRVGGYSPNDLSQWATPVANVLQQQMDAMKTFVEANAEIKTN